MIESPGNLPIKVIPVWQIKQELIPHFKDGEAEAGLGDAAFPNS